MKIIFKGGLEAFFNEDCTWNCDDEDVGDSLTESLNFITQEIRRKMSPADGDPRAFLLHTVANRVNATVADPPKRSRGRFNPDIQI